ncbi:hypothetical protein TWF102_002548 [Orbilia oligospora]|uniref:Uncharacterized protein n=1 Tax=Orbilia oligospora TaxID=2813651 RepID=A0A7C8JAF7_ORBOL|nr:hypothetical protein TWF102_002548 [Orbilia oligospora]
MNAGRTSPTNRNTTIRKPLNIRLTVYSIVTSIDGWYHKRATSPVHLTAKLPDRRRRAPSSFFQPQFQSDFPPVSSKPLWSSGYHGVTIKASPNPTRARELNFSTWQRWRARDPAGPGGIYTISWETVAP